MKKLLRKMSISRLGRRLGQRGPWVLSTSWAWGALFPSEAPKHNGAVEEVDRCQLGECFAVHPCKILLSFARFFSVGR